MKRISATLGVIFGGLLLTFVLASPASAGGTAGPTPTPTACPAGQFMSPLGCTLIGSNSGADGAQTPVTPSHNQVNPHELPNTGARSSLSTLILVSFAMVIMGTLIAVGSQKR